MYKVRELVTELTSEIDKFKWIESERYGYDIGIDKAAHVWIDRYYNDWFKKFLLRHNNC